MQTVAIERNMIGAVVRKCRNAGPTLVNFVLYQAGWFSCVIGAANDRPWSGAGVAAVLVLVHLALVARPVAELRLLLAAGLIGGMADSLQAFAGLLAFRSVPWSIPVAPPWIVVMWMQFATLFQFGFSFLRGRYLLGALLAALGGPLAYWVGSGLGAVDFPPPVSRSLIVLGLVWSGALPFLLWLSVRWTASEGRYRGFAARVG